MSEHPKFKGATVKDNTHYDNCIEIEFRGYNLDIYVDMDERTVHVDLGNEWRSPSELSDVIDQIIEVADWVESLPDGDDAG